MDSKTFGDNFGISKIINLEIAKILEFFAKIWKPLNWNLKKGLVATHSCSKNTYLEGSSFLMGRGLEAIAINFCFASVGAFFIAHKKNVQS